MAEYKASWMERQKIQMMVRDFRRRLGISKAVCVDILRIVENVLPQIFGDEYQFLVLPESEMGTNHGLTTPETLTIRIREDVYKRARAGQGRDRFTIAHELAHLWLHDGIVLGLARAGRNEVICRQEDPEWQANAFAGELLMDAYIIRPLTIEEVARYCKVSQDAARVQKNFGAK